MDTSPRRRLTLSLFTSKARPTLPAVSDTPVVQPSKATSLRNRGKDTNKPIILCRRFPMSTRSGIFYRLARDELHRGGPKRQDRTLRDVLYARGLGFVRGIAYNPLTMGFREARQRVVRSLLAGDYQIEIREVVEGKNLLEMGDVTPAEVVSIVAAAISTCAPPTTPTHPCPSMFFARFSRARSGI
jgi:hypothetical protein